MHVDRNSAVLSNVLQVRCLGAFAFGASGAWYGGPAFKSGREFLQYLLSYHRFAIPKQTLADAFWPELDADAVIHRLHLAVSGARAALREVFPQIDAIRCCAGSYGLHPGILIDSDMDVLLDVSRDGSIASMEAAVGRYSGGYMAGERAEWMYPLRIRCANAYIGILERLADTAAHNHDIAKALEYAMRLVEIDRAHEGATRTVMRLLAQSGRRGAALNQFDDLARYLKRHLAIEPSAQTRALRDEIVRGGL